LILLFVNCLKRRRHIEEQRIGVVGEGSLTHLLVCFDIVELLEE